MLRTLRGLGHRLLAPGPRPSGAPGTGVEPAFVGRHGELERAECALDAARLPRGRVLVLSGAPGIGKTRLAEEVAERARLRGFATLAARAPAAGELPHLWPWARIARQVMNAGPGDPLRRLSRCARAEVARLIERAALRRRTRATAPADRRALFDGVEQLLAASAAVRPTLVLLDDVHRADVESLELLDYLAHDLDLRGIVFVVALVREALEVEPEHAARLERLLARSASEAWQLGGLERDAVDALVEQLAGRRLPELASVLAEITGGHPGRILGLVRSLEAEQALDPTGHARLRELVIGPARQLACGPLVALSWRAARATR